MKRNIVLILLCSALCSVSCTEKLQWWQESLQNVEAELSFDIPGNEDGDLPGDKVIEGLINIDPLGFTINILNRGLEPRDGMLHVVGALYLYVEYTNTMYEYSFSRTPEDEYVEVYPLERYPLYFVWDKFFDGGENLRDVIIESRTKTSNNEIRFWVKLSFLRYYTNIVSDPGYDKTEYQNIFYSLR